MVSRMHGMISMFNAIIVAGCLLLFLLINLDNLMRYHKFRSTASSKPEVEKEIAFPLLLVGVGTIGFFLESFVYVILGYSIHAVTFLSYGFGIVDGSPLESVGLFVMVLGYAIFIWSVIARGPYATSWQMPVNHKLVDWGPYRYVRHPSYLGYFLMFTGFILLWHALIALVALVAIPGYVLITRREEEMLVAMFGRQYTQYQKNAGRFFPKMRRHKLGSES